MFRVVPAIYTCAPCDKKCKAYINARHRPEQHGRFILQKYSKRLENISCCYNSARREKGTAVRVYVREKKEISSTAGCLCPSRREALYAHYETFACRASLDALVSRSVTSSTSSDNP